MCSAACSDRAAEARGQGTAVQQLPARVAPPWSPMLLPLQQQGLAQRSTAGAALSSEPPCVQQQGTGLAPSPGKCPWLCLLPCTSTSSSVLLLPCLFEVLGDLADEVMKGAAASHRSGLLPCTGRPLLLLHCPAGRSATAGLQPVGLRVAAGKSALPQIAATIIVDLR